MSATALRSARVVHRSELRPGLHGLGDTLKLIREAITDGGMSLKVRADAEDMCRYAGSRDRHVIEAIFEGVLGIDQPLYGYDPLNVELLRTAEAVPRAKRIDCDDFVVRAGALLESMGIPTRPVVWGKRVQTSAQPRFSHVYLQAFDRQGRKWVDFDPVLRRVRRDARAGDRPPNGVRGTMIQSTVMQGALLPVEPRKTVARRRPMPRAVPVKLTRAGTAGDLGAVNWGAIGQGVLTAVQVGAQAYGNYQASQAGKPTNGQQSGSSFDFTAAINAGGQALAQFLQPQPKPPTTTAPYTTSLPSMPPTPSYQPSPYQVPPAAPPTAPGLGTGMKVAIGAGAAIGLAGVVALVVKAVR